MEATRNYAIAIGATQEANSIIYNMYEGYISRLVVVRYLVRPHVRHVCVLLPFVRPYVRHAYLGLHIAISLKGRTTRI